MTEKDKLQAVSGIFSSILFTLVGQPNTLFICLLILMFSDIISGLIAVLVFHKSKYTGKLSSEALMQGFFRKCLMFVGIMIGHQIDVMLGYDWVRNTVIYYLIATEGLSIIENMGRCGVPLPTSLQNILDVMKDKSDKGENKDG